MEARPWFFNQDGVKTRVRNGAVEAGRKEVNMSTSVCFSGKI